MSGVKESKPLWAFGDAVWYDSGTVGLLFRATICSEPFLFAGDLWVAKVNELPEEYRTYSGRSSAGPVLVLVDSPCNIYQRRQEDNRPFILWNEYREEQLARTSRTKRANALEEVFSG